MEWQKGGGGRVEFLIPMLSGFGGALVGALLSGRLLAYSHYLKHQKWRREEEARTLMHLFQALLSELEALWTGYTTLVGEELERLDKPEDLSFAGLFSASQQYTAVYDLCAPQLGILDPESARRLIDTYVNLKIFFDELNTYQRLTDRHQAVRLKGNVNLFEVREIRQEHERYFAYLKKRHFQVKGLVVGAIELLREFISLGERARTAVTIRL